MKKKKKVEEKFAQLYSVRIDRMERGEYAGVIIGSVQFVLYADKIGNAYSRAVKKGIEIFGYSSSVGGNQHNVVEVKIVPMCR